MLDEAGGAYGCALEVAHGGLPLAHPARCVCVCVCVCE